MSGSGSAATTLVSTRRCELRLVPACNDLYAVMILDFTREGRLNVNVINDDEKLGSWIHAHSSLNSGRLLVDRSPSAPWLRFSVYNVQVRSSLEDVPQALYNSNFHNPFQDIINLIALRCSCQINRLVGLTAWLVLDLDVGILDTVGMPKEK